MWGLPQKKNARRAYKIRLCGHLRRYKKIVKKTYIIYVKTEIFPRKLGKKIAESEEIRHASDYDDFYIATKVEAEEQIQTAKELVKLVEEYVQKRWAQEEWTLQIEYGYNVKKSWNSIFIPVLNML